MKNHQIKGFFVVSLINCLFSYFGYLKSEGDWKIFLIVLLFFGALNIVLGVIIPLRTIYFLGRTITSIRIKDGICEIYTSEVLWVKARTVKISMDNLIFRRNNFPIYESKPLKGAIITDKLNNKRYHLVEIFYDDYGLIAQSLSRK